MLPDSVTRERALVSAFLSIANRLQEIAKSNELDANEREFLNCAKRLYRSWRWSEHGQSHDEYLARLSRNDFFLDVMRKSMNYDVSEEFTSPYLMVAAFRLERMSPRRKSLTQYDIELVGYRQGNASVCRKRL